MNLSSRDIVIGPGHSLNELTNRLLTIIRAENHSKDLWEMYPGTFGLYARHGDDYQHIDNPEEVEYYNNYIRNSTDNSTVKDYKSSGFYVNCVADIIKDVTLDVDGNFYSTYLDMENYPMNRFHYLMMEFSIGAAEDLDYTKEPSLSWLCHRVKVKTEMENQYMQEHPNLIWVHAGQLLQKDYTSLKFLPHHMSVNHEKLLDPVIDKYNYLNQVAHPIIKDIVELSWEGIIAIADEYNDLPN